MGTDVLITLAMCCYLTACKDALENCAGFGSDACKGLYEAWARDNCALTCGYCVGRYYTLFEHKRQALLSPTCTVECDGVYSYK